MNDVPAADDPFANINPLDGVDPSKIPQKLKSKRKQKKLPTKTKLCNILQNDRVRVKAQIDGNDLTVKIQNLTEQVLSKLELKLDEPMAVTHSLQKVAGKKQKSIIIQIQSENLSFSSSYSGSLSIGSDVQSFNSKVYVSK